MVFKDKKKLGQQDRCLFNYFSMQILRQWKHVYAIFQNNLFVK